MHGLGNDFVIINQTDLPNKCDLANLSLNIANRHIGLGCDQFIIYHKKIDYYQMIIYNQNGSIAKLCGNAARAIAKLIYLDSGQKEIILNAHGRELFCRVLSDNQISVNVGEISFNESC
jgi:diaminopimelate epimerase